MPRARKDQNSSVQPTQGVKLATGLPQGERKMLAQSQAALPLPDDQARLQQAISAAEGTQTPDLLLQPTSRPMEPPTAGMLSGPGAGPSAVQPIMTPATQDESGIAAYLPMLEMLADQPGATAASRNFVRQIRGSLPPQVTQEALVNRGSTR